MIQSARAVPGAVTRWLRVLTRPSRLVVVPRTSANPAAGSTTSAWRTDSVRNRSVAITVRAPARPRSARSRSGKSLSGSAPSRISVSILPAAAAARMPAASRPRTDGTRGHSPATAPAPSASVVRPARRPGAMPMSMAPWTLARRSAERKRWYRTSVKRGDSP